MLLSSELQLTLTLEQVLSQTILTPLTAHSKNQLTTERNTSFHTDPSYCVHPSPPLFPSHTHIHTDTHTDTHKLTNTHIVAVYTPYLPC